MKPTTQTQNPRPYAFTVPDAPAASTFPNLHTAIQHAWHVLDAGIAKTLSIVFTPSGDTLVTMSKGETIR